MKVIYDLGMYDASDTIYYLENGYEVVAVEANPALVHRAEADLKRYLDSGQLHIVHAAVGPSNAPVELTICGEDLGSSSIYGESVEHRTPVGSFTVSGITIQELFGRFGVPHYLKIDIEGADLHCVTALTSETKPAYLSFEIGEEFERLLAHVKAIGFSQFKLINQTNLREFANEAGMYDRVAMGIVRRLGYAEPRYVRRSGRYFKLGHSSGPVPWKSDGTWCSPGELAMKWEKAKDTKGRNVWYDLHAM